jgi:hypothetical protein
MRKTVRLFSQVGPEERLARAISELPPAARHALRDVAEREDLPLTAGDWSDDGGGCLVANVVQAFGAAEEDEQRTLDVRVLDLFPELSSRDLNHLIVAWDEAAAQEGRAGDPALRRLLRGALARAGEQLPGDIVADDALLDVADEDGDDAADERPIVRAPLGVPSRV